MFATIKSLIPEPRQVDQPRRYIGRHRGADTLDLPDVDGGPDVGDLATPEDVETPAAADPETVGGAESMSAAETVSADAETVSADAGPPERVA